MAIEITLKNPATGETWTSGKRGRRPTWVVAMVEAGTVNLPVCQPPAWRKAETPRVPGMLRAWKWVGVAGEDGDDDDRRKNKIRCMIIAKDESDALRVAASAMRYPISSKELQVAWKELDASQVEELTSLDCGCYEYHNEQWRKRLINQGA